VDKGGVAYPLVIGFIAAKIPFKQVLSESCGVSGCLGLFMFR